MATHHRADEKRFLDERGSSGPLAPNGMDPSTIMEKATIQRIIDCYFWKDQCFAVNEATLVDRVVNHVHFMSGTYGDSQKPSPFLCLALKLLQLAPSDDILQVYLDYGGEKFKYLRALALFYIRLTRQAKDVYTTLEPYLVDRRKLKRKTRTGTSLTYMDQFVDDLLVQGRMFGTTLAGLAKREHLEDLEILEPRISPLGDIEDLLEEEDLEETENGDIENGNNSESGESPGPEFGEGDDMDVDHPDK